MVFKIFHLLGPCLFNKNKQQEMAAENSTAKNGKPPAALVKKRIKNVEHEYRYLKTVHSIEELDDFRFKNGCKFADVKRRPGSKSLILHCTRRAMKARTCQFSLMVQRTTKGGNEFHVYAHSQHNHTVKPEAERVAQRVPRNKLVSDTNPSANFTTPDGRQWTLLTTTKNTKKMDQFRLKQHCQSQKKKYKQSRINMECNNKRIKCQFRLLALKTDRGRFHMYANGRHTCRYENGNKNPAFRTKSVKQKNAGKSSEWVQDDEEEEEQQMNDEENVHEEEVQMDGEAEAKKWPIEQIKRQLSDSLREGNAGQVDKLMSRTGQRRIGALLHALDRLDMIKLLQMAERKILEGRSSSKENISSADWLIWLQEVLREVLLLLSLAKHSQLAQVHQNFAVALPGPEQGMPSSSSMSSAAIQIADC